MVRNAWYQNGHSGMLQDYRTPLALFFVFFVFYIAIFGVTAPTVYKKKKKQTIAWTKLSTPVKFCMEFNDTVLEGLRPRDELIKALRMRLANSPQ